MMDTSVVTVKGQIVIPVKLRKRIGLKKGTRVFLEERGGDIIVHAATPDFYERTYGVLKGGRLVKSLEASRHKEKQYEEKKIERA
jgi:AbrB family looped-hinge helix DNA binding protein